MSQQSLKSAVEDALEAFEQKSDCACDVDFCCYFHRVERSLRSGLRAPDDLAAVTRQRDELLGATKEYMKAARPDARRALKAVIEQIEGAPMPDKRRKVAHGPHSSGGALAVQDVHEAEHSHMCMCAKCRSGEGCGNCNGPLSADNTCSRCA